MKKIISKSRRKWAAEGGAHRKYTTSRVRRAFQLRRQLGWLVLQPADGPQHEWVTAINRTDPLGAVARDYADGIHWFDRQYLEATLQATLDSSVGACKLAKAGLALLATDGTQVQLIATDPRLALLVNRSRLGPQVRGYGVHKILEIILHLPPRNLHRRPATEDRRLLAALVLQERYNVDGIDLCNCRPFVHLQSPWTLASNASNGTQVA